MAGDYNMMDDESSPSQPDNPMVNEEESSDETEDQLALVPTSFFQNKKGEVKPGMREMVEVVQVYENEVSIKCVYEEKEEESPEGEMMEDTPAPPEDAMMA